MTTPIYHVSHQGKTIGPFELDFIEAMLLAGQFRPDTQVRLQGTEIWQPLSTVTTTGEKSPPLPPPQNSARNTRNADKILLRALLKIN
ncbi:MAG: DUF4339 domain-containing protein [Puniceicoccales bacterium]|nr:DUF4339 domain-containing protein [Puniceicoccales bacterium]